MTFQAYIDIIRAKTGKTPDQLKEAAEKAGDLVKFLKHEFDLGHGNSIAIWLVFKQKSWVIDPKDKK